MLKLDLDKAPRRKYLSEILFHRPQSNEDLQTPLTPLCCVVWFVFFSPPFESQIFHSCTEFLWLHHYLLCLDRLRMSFHWWVVVCFGLVCVFSFFPSFITVPSTPASPSKSKTALLFIEKHKYLWCSIHQHKCITWPQSVLVTKASGRYQNKWRTGTIQHGVKALRLPLQTRCVLWERAVVFAYIFLP